jgi:hypothetical protein
MPRTVPVLLSFAAFCLIAGSAVPSQAQELAAIPNHFFSEWSVKKDCSEQHAGPQGHVQNGLKFKVSRTALAADGQAFTLEVRTPDGENAPGSWQNVRVEYRAGVRMTTLPADFECTPGAETTSPFLAMGNYSTSAEPWYEYEHWVGLVDIHGQKHHLLIFPRDVKLAGTVRAVIVLHDADASDNVKLDHGGAIHTQ